MVSRSPITFILAPSPRDPVSMVCNCAIAGRRGLFEPAAGNAGSANSTYVWSDHRPPVPFCLRRPLSSLHLHSTVARVSRKELFVLLRLGLAGMNGSRLGAKEGSPNSAVARDHEHPLTTSFPPLWGHWYSHHGIPPP